LVYWKAVLTAMKLAALMATQKAVHWGVSWAAEKVALLADWTADHWVWCWAASMDVRTVESTAVWKADSRALSKDASWVARWVAMTAALKVVQRVDLRADELVVKKAAHWAARSVEPPDGRWADWMARLTVGCWVL
jgi:hypothetical protein